MCILSILKHFELGKKKTTRQCFAFFFACSYLTVGTNILISTDIHGMIYFFSEKSKTSRMGLPPRVDPMTGRWRALVGALVVAVVVSGVVGVAMAVDIHRSAPRESENMEDRLLITLLVFSVLTAFCGSILINVAVQGTIVPTGFLTHYPGSVCGLGVLTGILLCGIFLVQIGLIARKKRHVLHRWRFTLVAIILLYFVLQLLMNSTVDYRVIRPALWENYCGPGLWDYMTPTYVLQTTYFILIFIC